MDHNRRRKSVKKSKELGRVAQASIIHNYTLVEDFIAALQSGAPTPYSLGRVEKALGGGAFDVVMLGEGITTRAKVRQLMHGRGRFHHNPEVTTAARVGSYVVVEDIGTGRGVTHQIMGVADMSQAIRAMTAAGVHNSSALPNMYNFGSSSNSVNNLANVLTELGITPTYVRRQTTMRATTNPGGGAGGPQKFF
jgi:hypothetical protein